MRGPLLAALLVAALPAAAHDRHHVAPVLPARAVLVAVDGQGGYRVLVTPNLVARARAMAAVVPVAQAYCRTRGARTDIVRLTRIARYSDLALGAWGIDGICE